MYCTEHTYSYITDKWLYTHFTQDHFSSLHCTSLRFFTSLHFWPFRHHLWEPLHFFSSITITSLTLFLNTCDLQRPATSVSAGNGFHSLIVVFAKQYLPISVLCFLVYAFCILHTWNKTTFKRSLGGGGYANLWITTQYTKCIKWLVSRNLERIGT